MNPAYIKPTLIRRTGNRGWLAVSPSTEPIKIGVEAQSAREAAEKYEATLNRWLAILVNGAMKRP